MRALACTVSLLMLIACSKEAPPSEAEPAAEEEPEVEPEADDGLDPDDEPEPEPEGEDEPDNAGEDEDDDAPAAADEAEAEPEAAAGPAKAQPAAKARAPEAEPAAEPAKAPEAEPAKAEPAAERARGVVEGPCGEKGQPMCPLQAWMEKNLQGPFDDGDLAKVAANLRKVKGFSPDASWNGGDKGWATSVDAGVKAAEAGDTSALKQSCKTCHKAWRKKYKAEHRLDSVAP